MNKTVHETVKAMINEIGELRQFVAIDSMPDKLQQVRQLLRELDYELEQAERSKTSTEEDLFFEEIKEIMRQQLPVVKALNGRRICIFQSNGKNTM